MINKKYTSLATVLVLVAALGLVGAVSASAQTMNTNTPNALQNSQNYINSADMNANANANSTNGSLMNTNTTDNSIYPSATGTSSNSTINGTSNVQGTTNTQAPGVPNTGNGGEAPVNLAFLVIAGILVAAGMSYVTLRLAL